MRFVDATKFSAQCNLTKLITLAKRRFAHVETNYSTVYSDIINIYSYHGYNRNIKNPWTWLFYRVWKEECCKEAEQIARFNNVHMTTELDKLPKEYKDDIPQRPIYDIEVYGKDNVAKIMKFAKMLEKKSICRVNTVRLAEKCPKILRFN